MFQAFCVDLYGARLNLKKPAFKSAKFCPWSGCVSSSCLRAGAPTKENCPEKVTGSTLNQCRAVPGDATEGAGAAALRSAVSSHLQSVVAPQVAFTPAFQAETWPRCSHFCLWSGHSQGLLCPSVTIRWLSGKSLGLWLPFYLCAVGTELDNNAHV